MGSCSSISSRPPSKITHSSARVAQRVVSPREPGSSLPSAPWAEPTKMERFFETRGNAMEEMVFNSATGKLEIVSKEDSERLGRHVVLDMNKPGGGGFFLTQSRGGSRNFLLGGGGGGGGGPNVGSERTI